MNLTPETAGEQAGLAADATIQGYVIDNMEGAVDQATFLATTDMPIAVVGPRGTGKMYIAKVVHQESVHAEGEVVSINCGGFRNRKEAATAVQRELGKAGGKTLVFKSPHLMNPDVQNKLARQLSTRVLADVSPARYLPNANFVALFPHSIEQLMQQGGLSERLASVFAGFPINVPPIKDRKQAVLRWAQKILGQECIDRGREIRGFSPDAEKAMLKYDWPGNINEMRQRVVSALDSTDGEWLTPVDLGIYRGEELLAGPSSPELKPYLEVIERSVAEPEPYRPSPLEELDVALGEAVNSLLRAGQYHPLGDWLADEIVVAVRERFQGDGSASASFLRTRPRNISRWLPQIEEREHARNGSGLWRDPRQRVLQWILEMPPPQQSPLQLAAARLLCHLEHHDAVVPLKTRALVLGVSVPTYQKRLRELEEE